MEYISDEQRLIENDQPEHVQNGQGAQNSDDAELSIPTDRYWLVSTLFFLLGVSQLLPFNFLITADDLWMYKFRDVNNQTKPEPGEKSELQEYFASFLTIACNAPFLMIYLVSLTKHFQRISSHLKNYVSFCLAILVFSLITGFVIIKTDQFQKTFLVVLLCLVFLVNGSTITIQANVTGVASLFPSRYMHLMVTGQAMSGLIATLLKIISLVANQSLVYSVFVFFLQADFILLITFGFYLYLKDKPFYKFYSSLNNSLNSSNITNIEEMNRDLLMRIFKQMWPYCLALMFVFWVTISIYPSLFILITPPKSEQTIPSKFILPVTCFLIFNIGDFLGRYVGRYFLLRKDHGVLLLSISICRIAFIPLFLYCNAQPRHNVLVIFRSEICFAIFNLVFALLNGYLVLNSFVNGPLSIPEQYRHMSGYFLVPFLGLGLTLGSLTSPLILKIL